MSVKADETNTWPDLAIGLYERLTGSNAEITYQFDKFEMQVPSSTAADAARARWELNGILKIRTANA
jgi:hypothetical protein